MSISQGTPTHFPSEPWYKRFFRAIGGKEFGPPPRTPPAAGFNPPRPMRRM